MSKLTKALTAAAGNAGESLYVEDVFSTNLYVGNGSALVVNTGLDQQTEGGMLWVKSRSDTANNGIWDTERTNGYYLPTNSSDNGGNISAASGSVPFLRDGSFRWNSGHNWFNKASSKYASWAFRKAEKFFDVVTWTGDGVAGREIAHNLGSVPAVIITKRYDASGAWWTVYHKNSPNSVGWLNETNAFDGNDMQYYYGNGSSAITPTSSVFTVSDSANVNGSSATYVAYLFASDAGGFGDDGSESIIKCGSYTGNGSSDGPDIDLGFEPQWVLVKRATGGISFWGIYDSMRGVTTLSSGGGEAEVLYANLGDVADTNLSRLIFTPTGFSIVNSDSAVNGSGSDYIYIAIRRPMKTPKSGTEVFSPVAYSGNGSGQRTIDLDLTLDMLVTKGRNATIENIMYNRLSGTNKRLVTSSSANEASSSTNVIKSFDQEGITIGSDADINGGSYTYIAWAFKRAKGFFDTVMYTGNGVAGNTITHNLGVVPELIITKSRSLFFSGPWRAFSAYLNGETNPWEYELDLASNSSESSSERMNNTAPTSTVFSLNDNGLVNANNYTYVAHLFASVEGVSKVGTYTGTGDTGTNVIDCGFSAGARFVLIKQVSSNGNWYCFDTARGITDGNAGIYLQWNRTNAEVSNSGNVNIDPNASGFEFAGDVSYNFLNTLNERYIFLAIA